MSNFLHMKGVFKAKQIYLDDDEFPFAFLDNFQERVAGHIL